MVTPKADEPIRVTPTKSGKINDEVTAHGNEKSYQWIYSGTKAGYEGALGHPDPYDIKIQNVSLLSSGNVLTAIQRQTPPLQPGDTPYLHLSYEADNNSTSSTNVQRFFIRVVKHKSKNEYHTEFAAAKPLYIYRNGGNTSKWFVLNKENEEPKWKSLPKECYPSLHMRLHNKHEEPQDDRARSQFFRVKTHKYVIVGNDNQVRVSAYAAFGEDGKLDVPRAIKTIVPVEYTFYSTLADAQNNNTNAAITALPDIAATPTIYVRYTYNASDNELVKLDGSAKYTVAINNSYVKYVATPSEDSNVVAGENSEAEDGVDEYIWRTWGNDPYGIYVTSEVAGTDKYLTGTGTTSIATGASGGTAAIQMTTDSYTGHVPGRYFLMASPLYTPERPLFIFRAAYPDAADDATVGMVFVLAL